jgi:hypothetical protein
MLAAIPGDRSFGSNNLIPDLHVFVGSLGADYAPLGKFRTFDSECLRGKGSK